MTQRQKRNWLCAFAAAMALLIAYGLIGWLQRPKPEPELTLYRMEPDSVVRIQFEGAEGTVSLLRSEGGWVWEADESFPLNENFVESMLGKVASLTAERYVDQGRDAYAAYGLDHPSNVIEVSNGDETKRILLGAENSATGDSYLSLEGSDKIYTVDSTFATLFGNSIRAMASRESLPDMTLEDISGLSVLKSDGSGLAFTRDASGSGWSMRTQDGAEAQKADGALVSELLSKLIQLRYDEMIAYRPTAQEQSAFGLDAPTLTLEVDYCGKDGAQAQYVIRIGGRQAGEGEAGALYYAWPESGQSVYGVKESAIAPFMQLMPESFLSLDVAQVGVDQLDGIEITAGAYSTALALRRGSDGQVEAFTRDGAEITQAQFNAVYYQLYALSAEKRVVDLSEALTEQSMLTIVYRCTEEAGGDVTVELLPYDQNYCAARVNGRAQLLVNRKIVNELIRLIQS